MLINRDAYGPGQHRFNEGFRDFAKHHGFGPRMRMSNLFWLTDAQMERLRPFFPKSHGRPRVDDRRVLSGSEEDKKTIQ